MRLEIRLLGPFSVTLDGKPVEDFNSIKVRALLAYLAAESIRPKNRDQLTGLLWPDWPQNSAMKNLRGALYTLRKAIDDREADPPFLLISRSSLQFNAASNAKIDAIEFERLVSAEEGLEQGIELYQGSFLEDLSVVDSQEFESWVLSKRQYFNQKMLDGLGLLASKGEQSGNYEQGLVYARKRLELEPWLEEAHRQAMHLLVLAGRRSEALAQFETCRKILKSELGAEPASETIRLVEQIRSGKFDLNPQTKPSSQTEPTQSTLKPALPTWNSLPTGTALPTGTVTFLFTDIVGSTPLWERQSNLMSEALAIHNTTLREAIEAHGGVVFKTVGDALQCTFSTALPALRAAISGQRALHNADWNELGELKVRMGLHTGEAELDPVGDEYAVSHTKNRVARIMSAAYGGQVLLSDETSKLVDHHLSDDMTLKDLGEHSLMGLDQTEHLFQISAPGLKQDFPPLSSTVTLPNNLPLKMTSFIGREREIEQVVSLLEKHRLVTLTGVGGTGKTRLSLHVAHLVLEDYPNGTWLVELAGLSDPVLVPRTTASALNLPEIAGKPVTESLVNFLRQKRLLLILDNCEHLLEACANLADLLLLNCPDLTILASSREFLGVTGEIPFRLPPMELPDTRQTTTAAHLSEYDAVKLFVERARVVVPDFAVTADNAAAVVQVVGRLDGIPLAIELAAARLRLLNVAQVAQRLKDAFGLLTGGGRSVLPRHQTLRASIDWSYNLLSDPERTLLRRLSVFSGSWRLSAAEQVCADPPGPEMIIHPDEVLDLTSGLLDKSLIQTVHTSDGTNRFRMLETVRQYAHEKLVDEGESEAVRDHHLTYYLEWVEETVPKIHSREQVRTLGLLERELDNLRLALDWALQTDIEAELKIAASLHWFWHIHSRESEAIEWLEHGLNIAGMEWGQKSIDTIPRISENANLVRAWAMTVLGYFRWHQLWTATSQVDYAPEQAKVLLEEAIDVFQTLNPEKNQAAKLGLAWANVCLSWYLEDFEDERERARDMIQDALNSFRAEGDLPGMAESLQLLAYLTNSPEVRIQLHQEQLAIHEKLGDPHGIGNAYMFIGWAADKKGDYNAAVESFKAALEFHQQVNDPNFVHNTNLMIGMNLHFTADFAGAETYIQRALTGIREIGTENLAIWCLEAKAKLRLTQGYYDLVAEVNDQAWEIAQRSEIDVLNAIVLTLRSRLARLQGDIDSALKYMDALPPLRDMPNFHKILIPLEWGGITLQNRDLAQAKRWFREASSFLQNPNFIYIPPFMDGTALYAIRTADFQAAARLFGSRWCRAYVNFLSPIEREWREGDWAAMKAGLGDERFEALYEEGQSLSYEQAVAMTQKLLEK